MNTTELKHITAWGAVPIIAIVNGAIRDLTYANGMGRPLAHSLSALPLIGAIALWATVVGRRWPLPDRRSAIVVGGAWLGLTLGFELALGAVRGVSLSALLAEYDVSRGNLWPLVPLAMAFAPELVRLRESGRLGGPRASVRDAR